MTDQTELVSAEQIQRVILLVRGHKVLIDRELASMYGVETKQLNRSVRRNLDRFPPDFMFQLTAAEAEAKRTLSGGWAGKGG